MGAGIEGGGEGCGVTCSPQRYHRIQVSSFAATTGRAADRGEAHERSEGQVRSKDGGPTTGCTKVQQLRRYGSHREILHRTAEGPGSRCSLQPRSTRTKERPHSSYGWSHVLRMQEARARGSAVLDYPSGAHANGFATQEERRHVLASGGTQADESSRSHEP